MALPRGILPFRLRTLFVLVTVVMIFASIAQLRGVIRQVQFTVGLVHAEPMSGLN